MLVFDNRRLLSLLVGGGRRAGNAGNVGERCAQLFSAARSVFVVLDCLLVLAKIVV